MPSSIFVNDDDDEYNSPFGKIYIRPESYTSAKSALFLCPVVNLCHIQMQRTQAIPIKEKKTLAVFCEVEGHFCRFCQILYRIWSFGN